MSTPDLKAIASALGGEVVGGQVRAPGPGHSAHDRSLSIMLDANAPDGFLVNTFAQDDPIKCKDYVRQKCGFEQFKANGSTPRQRANRASVEDFMFNAINAQRQTVPQGQLVATFDYKDADGALLYQVLKYDNPRNYKQRRPNGRGDWIWQLDERRVLYRLPDLLRYPDGTVFFTEGEKDADRLSDLNLCATTVASGKWTSECVSPLAMRDVVILQDNDEAGRKRAIEAAQQLHGTTATLRVVLLPDLAPRGDVSDWLDADPRRIDKLPEICLAAPLWTPEQDSSTVDRGKDGKAEAKAADVLPTLLFVDMSKWDREPPPEREWATQERIPLRQPTLLSGEGAAGKSLLALQLCAAHVLGRDWLQTLPAMGPAIYFGAEDDADEQHRRLAAICEHYRESFSKLTAGGFHLLSYAGQDAVLGAPNRAGVIEPTPLFLNLHKAATSIQPKLIVLDTAADVFAGNENDRTQVRQFVGAALRRLAIEGNCAVLVCSHPSLTGINTGTGLSGSTAWHNSVRARMYLSAARTEDGEEPDPELRQLEFRKNNYGPLAERILLRWRNGVFVPESTNDPLAKIAADHKAEDLFLQLLDRFTATERYLNDRNGTGYAPAVFAQEPEAKAARISKRALGDAMRRLFAARRIRIESYGRPSRPGFRIVRDAV